MFKTGTGGGAGSVGALFLVLYFKPVSKPYKH
jgi:hypothetical protein